MDKGNEMIRVLVLLLAVVGPSCAGAGTVDIEAEVLRDKIRGGLLGQMLGNLNGLKYEMVFIDEPGDVKEYVPALPDGAWTDDDTDFEWVYIYTMQQENTILLSPGRISELWKERINRRIWCSNRYARYLMDIGIDPPLTGKFVLNPWADFNISGQFICETFALLAPAMPQTAAKIGLNYTHVTIDMEPAQATQLFTTMIATAFIESDIERIIDAGVAAIDPASKHGEVIEDVRRWHGKHPDNWRTTRRLLKDKYTQAGGGMRDKNGYELNYGSIVAALLYGKGDFAQTQRLAFNFGWDCDCNAATTGTILGVVYGYRRMMHQSTIVVEDGKQVERAWVIVDKYRNTTRENMPENETITSFADRVIDLAEIVIGENGGERKWINGRLLYRIKAEAPGNIEKLPNLDMQAEAMRKEMGPGIKKGIKSSRDKEELARCAYLAICLDMAAGLKGQYPERWNRAIEALTGYWRIMQNIYYDSYFPAGDVVRAKADAAGLKKPARKREVW